MYIHVVQWWYYVAVHKYDTCTGLELYLFMDNEFVRISSHVTYILPRVVNSI